MVCIGCVDAGLSRTVARQWTQRHKCSWLTTSSTPSNASLCHRRAGHCPVLSSFLGRGLGRAAQKSLWKLQQQRQQRWNSATKLQAGTFCPCCSLLAGKRLPQIAGTSITWSHKLTRCVCVLAWVCWLAAVRVSLQCADLNWQIHYSEHEAKRILSRLERADNIFYKLVRGSWFSFFKLIWLITHF